MKDISILIPTYNSPCAALVAVLQRQASKLGIDYEIVVADDGSTDQSAVAANRAINDLPHCRYVERAVNVGRAAIRNFLAAEARFDWLLFLDCDMEVADDGFLLRYATHSGAEVIDGGISIGGDDAALRSNLRYSYERHAAPRHTAEARSRNPYRSFRTTNFMASSRVMRTLPFDERFRHYGYEDVLFGKQLQQHGIAISHISNPTVLTDYESNAVFLEKTEEAMRTLHEFRAELRGYSRLLDLSEHLPHPVLKLLYRTVGRHLRRHLERKPSHRLYTIYRLLYLSAQG